MFKKKNQKGFTLVELLVVIAIIGILAVVAVPALFKNINKAKVADLQSDYNAFKSASLSYYADKNTYPSIENIAEYMESVPEKSPLASGVSAKYDMKLITTTPATSSVEEKKSLVLVATENEISKDQAKKLANELNGVIGTVEKKGTYAGADTTSYTFEPGTEANLEGTNKDIGLILIKDVETISNNK